MPVDNKLVLFLSAREFIEVLAQLQMRKISLSQNSLPPGLALSPMRKSLG